MSDKKPEPAAAPAAGGAHGEAPAGGGGGIKALLPAIIAIVLAPVATFAVAQFVLLPKLRETITAAATPQPAAGAAAAGHGAEAKAEPEKAEKGGHGEKKPEKGGHGEKKGEKGGEAGYKFENVVVNLAGTMGTRYLKVTFVVDGPKGNIKEKFDAKKPELIDVTLAVLGSLTLADLEEPGSKNIIRERLISAYNQTLGGKVVETLFFSDFVVQ